MAFEINIFGVFENALLLSKTSMAEDLRGL